jgi:hypothetical protein
MPRAVPRPIILQIQLDPCTENPFAALHSEDVDEGHAKVMIASPSHSTSFNVHLTEAEAQYLYAETTKLAAIVKDVCSKARERNEKLEEEARAQQKNQESPAVN